MTSRHLCTLAAGLGLLANVAGPAFAAEQPAKFLGRDDVPLQGTLTLPNGVAADHSIPAILLIQGSGPTDRDGNQPPQFQTDLLKQIAGFLADAGIASLRYDKRGMYANRSTMPWLPMNLPAFFDWSAFVEDAHGAFEFLRTQAAIDPARVGILGHSEGGLIALDTTTRHMPRPKVLVLAATPARPLGDVIHDQIAASLERQHTSAEEQKSFLDADARIRAQIIATGKIPSDILPGLAPLYPSYLGPFYQQVLPIDPAELARKIEGPIFVINGTGDVQVSATKDAGAYSTLLKPRTDGSEVFLAANVSHNLKPNSAATGGITGDIDAGVKDAIQRFLKDRL